MHTVENVTGRLVEVRVAPPLTLDEVRQFVEEHRATVDRIPDRYIGVVDLHRANVFPPEVAESLIQLLSRMADRVERSAFLIGESAVLALQIERIIRNSANPNRMAFRDPEPLKEWLEEVLAPDERLRLAGFLAGVGGQASGP
jgi:hypothetical protein